MKNHNKAKINRFGTKWLLLPKENIMRKLIPVNTSYYISESKGMKYGDGVELFPEQSKVGDRFITSDYIYTMRNENGWSVKVRHNDKTEYQAILGSINGVKTNSLARAFLECRKLKVAPAIPNGVKNLDEAFSNCISLEKAPTIPESVRNMYGAFRDCKKLVEAPKIPDGAWYLEETFCGCRSLIKAPEIPKSVAWMNGTFWHCTALKGVLVCHANIESPNYTLRGTQISAIEGSCTEETKRRLMETQHGKIIL